MAVIKKMLKWRYFCNGCTGRVKYAESPEVIHFAVCPKCGKVVDDSNYTEVNWLPMSKEEIEEVNR